MQIASRRLHAIGILATTNGGLRAALELARAARPDGDNYKIDSGSPAGNKREFLSRFQSLQDFLTDQTTCKVVGVYVAPDNLNLVALCAVRAHQMHVPLKLVRANRIETIDSREARLVESIEEIVRLFNLHEYDRAATRIVESGSDEGSIRARALFEMLVSLTRSYQLWDDRDFEASKKALYLIRNMIKLNRDDYGDLYRDLHASVGRNITFLRYLSGSQGKVTLWTAIEALFSGKRRYEVGDNLVAVLALANSAELALMLRLRGYGLNVNDPGQLTKKLRATLGPKADEYFKADHKMFDDGGELKLGFSFKPGFVDMIGLLRLLNDDYLNALGSLVNQADGRTEFSLVDVNRLRNKLIHNMGMVTRDDVEKCLKTVQVALEKLIELSPSLSEGTALWREGRNSLLPLNRYAQHVQLNAHAIASALVRSS